MYLKWNAEPKFISVLWTEAVPLDGQTPKMAGNVSEVAAVW